MNDARIAEMQKTVNEMIIKIAHLKLEMRDTVRLLTAICNEADEIIRRNNPKRISLHLIEPVAEKGTFKEQYAEYRNRLKRTYSNYSE